MEGEAPEQCSVSRICFALMVQQWPQAPSQIMLPPIEADISIGASDETHSTGQCAHICEIAK
jgi:hypothetical protein